MLFDFSYEQNPPAEYCFRFCEHPHPGPPIELPCAEGEVNLWIFVADRWSGPYSVGLPARRSAVAQHASELTGAEQWAIRDAIYTCKHRLRDIQRSMHTSKQTVTGKKIMEAYYQRFPSAKREWVLQGSINYFTSVEGQSNG